MAFSRIFLPGGHFFGRLKQQSRISLHGAFINGVSFSHSPLKGIKFMTTYSSIQDYVICGAGSAGCVLANRLSASSTNSVLLLEAGPKKKHSLYNDNNIWHYFTVPQKNLNNRLLYCPRGRVLGGSSSINTMVYNRGHAYDYDRWESEGAKGWSYADCLPYFKKAQTHELGADKYRGDDGPLRISWGAGKNPLFHAFIKAALYAGHPYTRDMNGFQQEGVGWMDIQRKDTASAYLGTTMQWFRRKRLHIESEALVTSILFEGNKAVGVEYQKDGQIKRARAATEVILSGGAINSPQLLMLSGIGDGDELKKHGIPMVCHLPGVGQNLQDHLQIIIQQMRKVSFSLLALAIQSQINKQKLGFICPHETGGFIRTRDIPQPNTGIFFLPFRTEGHIAAPLNPDSFQIHALPLRPQSRGSIKLKSVNPRDHLLIDFNYISTEEDWEEMRTCVRLAREIFQQKAFDKFRGKELSPGKSVQTDKEIDEFVRNKADTAYHPSCTCKMGHSSDKMAVVDNEARVFGVEGLRVVDASIMPSIVSGNTNAPTIMIAEKVADHILGNRMLSKSAASISEPEIPYRWPLRDRKDIERRRIIIEQFLELMSRDENKIGDGDDDGNGENGD